MNRTPEKQHPDSVNRDLDDEVAEAVEHQYARKLMKPVVKGEVRPDRAAIDKGMEQRRDKRKRGS